MKASIKFENNASDKCLPFSFDLPLTDLIMVDNLETLTVFRSSIEKSALVGIDTETQPCFVPKRFNPNRPPEPTSLVQVAVRQRDKFEKVFILDMLKLLRSTRDFDEIIQNIFERLFLNTSIIKIGQGLIQDVKELSESYPQIPSFRRVHSCLETNALHKYISPETVQAVSLKNLTRIYLHCNLIKKEQLSSWGRRPLTKSQILYAACDALVLLRLYDAMCSEAGDLATEAPFDTVSLCADIVLRDAELQLLNRGVKRKSSGYEI